MCTHRGNLLVEQACKTKKLVCGYHGRRFAIDGTFEHMPEFKEAKDFPRPCDNLHEFPLRNWGPFLFAGLKPTFDFQTVIDAMDERVGFLNLNAFIWERVGPRIILSMPIGPFIATIIWKASTSPCPPDLDAVLDYGQYDTVLHDHMNLQIGFAQGSETIFDFPNHPDYGKKIAAYYYWVFPNMMFNFYPWGLSVNLVQPLVPTERKCPLSVL